MPYNLPPPWNPGYALPENVVDEGLERQAFVTKYLPRGSYDDPEVGDGGYDVPQYVKDEGYGQGAFTTDWQPDGTYNGPRIPNWLNRRPHVVRTRQLPGGGRAVTVQPMGDEPMPEPFETYGQRAADGVIARVAGLPASQRAVVLRQILDKIDTSIWTRTQEIFARYRKQGIPPTNAFRMALSRAMAAGLAADIVTTGVRRSAPQAKSLLGLGCYGRTALQGASGLGDTPPPADAPGSTTPVPKAPISTDRCPAPAGFTWVEATPTVAGHWERLRKGQTPVAGPCDPSTGGTATPVVNDHRVKYDFFVGPFGFSVPALRGKWGGLNSSPDIEYISPDLNAEIPAQPTGSPVRPISADVLKWMSDRLREQKDANGKTDVPVHYTDTDDRSGGYRFTSFGANADQWFKAMGITGETPVRMHALWNLRIANAPWVGVKTPEPDNKQRLLRIQLAPAHWSQAFDPTTNPLVLKVWLHEPPSGDWWDKVTKSLSNPLILVNPLVGLQASAQIMTSTLDYLSELSCDMLKDENGRIAAKAAASAAAAYYGMPPEAGAKGVDMAAAGCGVQLTPTPPPVVPHKSVLPMVLLAGGAAAAVYFVTRKKKKP